MSGHSRTIERRHAARAHVAIHPSRKRSAAAHGHTMATEYVWANQGPPALVKYRDLAEDKWQMAAFEKVRAYEETVACWTTAECVARFHEIGRELRRAEFEVEEMEDGGAPQDLLATSEQNIAALREERAGLRLRFAKEQMTPAQIRGNR